MTEIKHTPCDCAEWRRLNEACAELLAERDDAKRLMYKDHQDHCHCERQLVNVTADRDKWKRLFTLNANDDRTLKDAERYRWLRNQGYSTSNGFFSLSFFWPHQIDFDEAIDAAMQEEQK